MAMRRRDCILLICGVAATWPLMVRAQQLDRVRRIGVLMGYADDWAASVAAFREEL
jgi:putative tryptophan/tyrosine transport system substrate-binding protein